MRELNTQLIAAVQNSDLELVKTLVSQGADLRVRDEMGIDLLEHAYNNDNREIVLYLLYPDYQFYSKKDGKSLKINLARFIAKFGMFDLSIIPDIIDKYHKDQAIQRHALLYCAFYSKEGLALINNSKAFQKTIDRLKNPITLSIAEDYILLQMGYFTREQKYPIMELSDDVSDEFKDIIIIGLNKFSLINFIDLKYKGQQGCSFLSLPSEMIIQILSYLSFLDLLACDMLCKGLRISYKEEFLGNLKAFNNLASYMELYRNFAEVLSR